MDNIGLMLNLLLLRNMISQLIPAAKMASALSEPMPKCASCRVGQLAETDACNRRWHVYALCPLLPQNTLS